MKKRKKLYDGKTKKLYETEEEEQLILEFKDTTNTDQSETIKGKGIINNQISSHIFEYLESFHIPTHFIKTIGKKEMLVKRLEMIPIEIVVHNIAAGGLCERFDIEEGKVLDYPVIEYFLKDKEHNNPMINTSHAISFGYAKNDELRSIERYSSKINAVLKSFFMRRGLKLIDFRLEFGRFKNKVVLGDEISPDTCHLWDAKSGEKLDNSTGALDIETAYQKINSMIFQK